MNRNNTVSGLGFMEQHLDHLPHSLSGNARTGGRQWIDICPYPSGRPTVGTKECGRGGRRWQTVEVGSVKPSRGGVRAK